MVHEFLILCVLEYIVTKQNLKSQNGRHFAEYITNRSEIISLVISEICNILTDMLLRTGNSKETKKGASSVRAILLKLSSNIPFAQGQANLDSGLSR